MMIAWASCLRSGVHLPLWLADDCDDDEEEKEDGNDVGDVDDDDDDDCDRPAGLPVIGTSSPWSQSSLSPLSTHHLS